MSLPNVSIPTSNIGLLSRVAQSIFRYRLLSVPISATLHGLKAYGLARNISEHSQFVPRLVSFAIPIGEEQEIHAKMHSAHSTDEIVRSIWLFGLEQYEKPLGQLFCRVVRDAQQVVDVGANSGLYSIISALASSNATVHAFEPFPPALRWLEANLALNSLSDRVKIMRYAIGDHYGEAKLYVPSKRFGDTLETSASLNADFREEHSEVLTVSLIPLDQYATDAQLRRLDVIKIDVESQEHVVLGGARCVLKLLRPIVFLEVLAQANTTVLEAIRTEADYISLWLSEEAIIKQKTVEYHRHAWNQILCPVEKLDWLCGVADELKLAFRDSS